jgi:hypothetical protein
MSRARMLSVPVVLGLALVAAVLGSADAAAEPCGGGAIVQGIPDRKFSLQGSSTEVLGTYAFEVGETEFPFGGTEFFDNEELGVGTTRSVALLWQFDNAPDAGASWRQVFRAPEGEATFDVSFAFDTATNLGCVTIVLNGNTNAPQRTCVVGTHSFLMLLFVNTRCTQVGDWNVSLSGPDPGANFFRPYTVRKEGVTLRMFHATDLQTELLEESPAGALAPAVPGGVGRVTVFAVDSLCTDLPLTEQEVEVQARFRPQSGGHTHQTDPIMDATVANRVLPVVQTFPGSTWTPGGAKFTATTSPGQFAVGGEFTAGQVSCILDWKALAPATADSTSGTTVIRVHTPMAAVPADANYHFDGGPGQPCGDPAFCDRHAENHNATPEMILAVQLFARIFFIEITGFRHKLGLNDMSLPQGGVFDINGNFRPSHHYHRRGDDVDVLFYYDLNGVPHGIAAGAPIQADVDEAAAYAGLVKVIEPQLHYRFSR